MKKATFTLQDQTLAALSDAVVGGAASSKNALVQRALDRELKEWRRRQQLEQWKQAMEDPAFLQDLRDIEEEFRFADAESLTEQ